MRRHILTIGLTALFSLGTSAQQMKAPKGGKAISDEFLGIFFEDISSSADGGLCAQLVQNGSFEYSPNERDGWGPGTAWKRIMHGHCTGYIDYLRGEGALNKNNPTYMRIVIERIVKKSDFNGWYGVGMSNSGHDGITVRKGQKYLFSAFLRNVAGEEKDVRILLHGVKFPPREEGQQGRHRRGPEQLVLGETSIKVNSTDWQKYEAEIEVNEDYDNADLQLIALQEGTMDVDMVSLLPKDTYKGHGLRKDLTEALEGLHPKFMRFPGGCIVHGGGDGFWNTYRWENTVGPVEQRVQLKNTWGYHQSMELGYFEYFQLCEDLGAQPVPILPCGVSCQGAGGGWGLKEQNQWAVPMEDMDQWTQSALDLIEWANGDINTKWGKVRAEAGHPAPFNLKYLGIGNEERITPEFEERFKYMYERITKLHPEIVIVGTAGPGSHPGNRDYDNAWKLAEEIGMPIMDEHYYERREYFFDNQHNYDKYPRTRKTKVYLGEYAAKDKKLIDALAEGLYLLGCERNGDVVAMTSYAPLFAKKGHLSWNPDLIYFDNQRAYLTCSYYVQQMFGQSAGQYYYGDCVQLDGVTQEKYAGQSVILNVKTRQLFVKICNADEHPITASLNLNRFPAFKGVEQTILSGDLQAENNFDEQPIAPVTTEINLKKKQQIEVPASSFLMLKITL